MSVWGNTHNLPRRNVPRFVARDQHKALLNVLNRLIFYLAVPSFLPSSHLDKKTERGKWD